MGADHVSRSSGPRLRNRLRELRLRAGLSQQALADAAGVTRQTVAGIEAGAYGPSASVALRLARALGRRVEEVFWLEDEPELEAQWASPPGEGGAAVRVRLAAIGERWWAWPIPAGRGMTTAADGLAAATAGGGTVRVRPLFPAAALRNTVVVAGCEPALELLAQHAFGAGGAAVGRALWCEVPNAEAIALVAQGKAHVAAVHGVAVAGRAVDLGLEGPVAPPPGYRVFHLARARQGWLFPKRIPFQGVHDLATGRLRLVNRPVGSGARALLDRTLAAAGLSGSQVPGYGNVAHGHLELAQAILQGRADVGVGSEAVAAALGLGFLPLQEERCELWVPAAYAELPPVAELLATLGAGPFRADLTALAPYDTRETGEEVTATAAP
jgi:putative molybdopterin biosynthesis protein